jgi:protein CpxP
LRAAGGAAVAGRSRGGGRSPAAGPGAAPQNVETSITQLRQRLQITPAQQPQFEALAAVMRENAQAPAGATPASTASAVDALRFAIRSEQQDLAGMRRLLPALQALYATLSPAQRQAADTVFRQGPGG